MHNLKNSLRVLLFLFIAALAFFAGRASNEMKIIFTGKAPKPIGAYSQAVMKDDFVFVSGQVAIDPVTNQLDTSNIENETTRVLENIKAVLEASGLRTANVVKSTIYLTDISKFKQVNEIYAGYFKENPPARETVQVAALPKGVHIEISVVAVK